MLLKGEAKASSLFLVASLLSLKQMIYDSYTVETRHLLHWGKSVALTDQRKENMLKKRALAVLLVLCISSVNAVGAFAASTSEEVTDQPAVEAEVEYTDEDKPEDFVEGTEQNLTENETEDPVEKTAEEAEPAEEEAEPDGRQQIK